MSTLEGQLLKSYNLGLVQLTIGGIPIGGYAADGGIEFEQSADLFEKTIGATGLPTYSLNNDDSIGATITVMETSLAYAALAALMQAQILAASATGVIPPLPFAMVDISTGDTIASAFTVFMARPNMNKGRVAGPREFRIDLVGAGAVATYGINNLI
jgi:hypothetical protein